jgi:hypothetical protein
MPGTGPRSQPSPPRRPGGPGSAHPLTRSLYGPLLADAQKAIRLALSVALLTEAGFNRSEVARRTGASPDELRAAWSALERVAPLIDRDSDP